MPALATAVVVCNACVLVLGLVLALTAVPAMALTWQVETTPSGEVFPSLELSRALNPRHDGFGDGNGLLRVRISGIPVPQQLRLTVRGAGLRESSVLDVKAEQGEITLRPHLQWDIDPLRASSTPRWQSLELTLQSPTLPTSTRSVRVRIHPLDEALYYVRDGNAGVDLGWIFAAYVAPDHAVVDHVLRLAFGGMPAPARDRRERLAQVRAVWLALEQHGLRYAEENPAISHGPVVYSQRVRLLDTIWNERIANCIDGSVLIASVLERLGLRASIVLVPGHAFVGFRTDGKEGGGTEFLETTLIGRHRHAGAESPTRLRQRAAANFEAARDAGVIRFRAAATRLDGAHRPDYAVIDIATARSYGILPLPIVESLSLSEER